jgi:type III pantothenate kinase
VAVSAQGDLEGVAIAPGLTTSGDSLFRATSTLPQVALTRPAAAIGKNTIQSMQAGFVFGFVGLVKELVQRLKAELGGNAHVVATGGLADLIAPETAVIDAVEPDLTLIGLRLMFEMNQPAAQA